MKVHEINVGMVTRSLDLYHRVAYAGQSIDKSPDLGVDPSLPIAHFLDRFEDETIREDSKIIHRYILRLGNSAYPFMKFVLQEHIVVGEYFFSVDTHDDMFKGESAERNGVARIRGFNTRVKDQIERVWSMEGFPTTATHKVLIQENRLLKREAKKGKNILIVDDDREIGDTIQLVLEARGFGVERLFDGIDAVDEADPKRHDLIIMDNEMEIMDGIEACRRLKSDPTRCGIPIIITTTRNLDLARLNRADAFLMKPFLVDPLMSFIHHLLGIDREERD